MRHATSISHGRLASRRLAVVENTRVHSAGQIAVYVQLETVAPIGACRQGNHVPPPISEVHRFRSIGSLLPSQVAHLQPGMTQRGEFLTVPAGVWHQYVQFQDAGRIVKLLQNQWRVPVIAMQFKATTPLMELKGLSGRPYVAIGVQKGNSVLPYVEIAVVFDNRPQNRRVGIPGVCCHRAWKVQLDLRSTRDRDFLRRLKERQSCAICLPTCMSPLQLGTGAAPGWLPTAAAACSASPRLCACRHAARFVRVRLLSARD